MKKSLLAPLAVVLGLASIPFAIAAATRAGYASNHLACDKPVDEDRLRELHVELPAGARACRLTGKEGYYTLQLQLAKPSTLCLATAAKFGCTSPTEGALSVVHAMEGDWDTGDLTSKDPDSVELHLRRGHDGATVQVFRTRFGEVTATMLLSLDTKTVGKK